MTTIRNASSQGDVVLLTGLALSAIVMAPIIEEVLFRGLLYGVLRHLCGVGVVIFVSLLPFALK